ncbi:DNA polymerase III subunit chi [Shewanella sp. OPT22]|nr:DNA polymerase III subunit chi [Shewanella sp. OPT22]
MQGTFYLLSPNQNQASQSSALVAVQELACKLAEYHYRQKSKVYIHCGSRTAAFDIDETLWQFDPQSFVPHNLKGEGLEGCSPVEIGFDQIGPSTNRHLLINLADQVPSFAVNFGQIIDFVAADEKLKAIARDRFRQYKAMGVKLNTHDLAQQPLNI